MKQIHETKHGSTEPLCSLVLGKNLTRRQLHDINLTRKAEFNSKSEIDPRPGNDDWDKPYFLVHHGEDLVAFGRLHNVRVESEGVPETILGIASIAAIQKEQGYGRVLMQGMRSHIETSGQTAVGFCDPAISGFYEACGYSVLRNGVQRFTYLDDLGQTAPTLHPNDDVLYVNGERPLINPHNAEQQIIAFRPSW
jgi:hypothetical protein